MGVLRSNGEDYTYEWVYGPWKAEVNFNSQDILLQEAATVDEKWPLTHGSYSNILALYDPAGFFTQLRQIVVSQPEEKFTAVIRGVIVGELNAGLVSKKRAKSHFKPVS
jgi:kanamycin nucleotidyltransferase